jgi:RND family efflux transporter MFP subunit
MLRPPLPQRLLVGALAGACAREAAVSPADATVASLQTSTVEAAEYTPTAALDGSLEPVAAVQLGFDVPGRVESLLVARGDTVSRGQALATLDAGMARAQLAQAEAAVAGAEAQLAAAEAAWGRAQQLHGAGGMSDQQFGEAEAQIAAGRAGVQQARAAAQLARTHLGNHTLRSPIAGTVSAAPDNAGMMVGAGIPVFLIEDLSSLQLKGSVGESDAWITAGMTASVVPGSPGSTETVPATVLRVLPALDPVTRRLPVELRVESSASLRAHGYARATIRATAPLAVVSVPSAAIVARPDFGVVARRDEAWTKVPVAVLVEVGDHTLVRAELQAGETVVLYPPTGVGAEQ